MSIKPAVRNRNIRLPETIDSTRMNALQTALQNLDGINDVRRNGTLLTINYTFPETGFDRIWDIVKQHIDKVPSRLRHTLAANMEHIEREHGLFQCGWDIYVRDIHVAHHLRETERRNKQPRKPWQQTKRPANPFDRR